MSKVWFVTGCSSGFGRVLCEELLKKGKPVRAICQLYSAIGGISAAKTVGQRRHERPKEYAPYFVRLHSMSAAAREYALDFMEAPPKNRAVILTTTETEWCEERLFSRFYTIRFAKPNADMVAAHLKRIAEREGFDVGGLNLKRFVQDRHNNIRLCLMDLEIEAAVALAA